MSRKARRLKAPGFLFKLLYYYFEIVIVPVPHRRDWPTSAHILDGGWLPQMHWRGLVVANEQPTQTLLHLRFFICLNQKLNHVSVFHYVILPFSS